MHQISLQVYKESKQYLWLFEIIMKNQGLNKDEFLLSHGISPTSFRRARSSEQRVGIEIIEKLSKIFDYRVYKEEEIDQIELLLNQIYNEVYFKIYDNFDSFFEKIENELNRKSILFPILNLFKMFLILNEHKQRKDTLRENQELFNDLQKYGAFYNQDLKEIYEIVELIFMKDIPDEYMRNEYKNGLIYYSLASKYNFNKDYIASLYFADRARKIFLQEDNFLRIFFLNLIYMHNYNSLGNYKICCELAGNQLLSLKSLEIKSFIQSTTELHLVIAHLGLRNYKKVIELLSNKEVYQSTEVYSLLIAKFMIDKKEYQELYNSTIKDNQNRKEDLYIIQTLNSFLLKRDKNNLMKLEKSNMREMLVKILKKNFFEE